MIFRGGGENEKDPLLFSDSTFGTEEFGFISTPPGEDPDDADRRYEKHLRDQGVPARVDRMGNVVLERKTKVMKITESRLRQIIREEISGTPHSGSGPRYALAFIDAVHGDRRLEWVVHEEDAELAREVLKKMRRQGQRSGVQPTRRRFDPQDVTTREDLMRML